MGMVIVLIGEQVNAPLADKFVEINKCGGAQVLVNDTSMPKCFQPQNSSVPSEIVESTDLSDSTNTIIFCLVLTAVNFLLLVICLQPKYRRMELEKQTNFEKSLAK